MAGDALAAVLCSSFLHALWNLFNKGSADRWAFFLGQGMVMAVLYGPVAAWLLHRHGLPATAIPWIALSALSHAAYAVYLLKAYDAGDFSVAYPLSRTAPVLLALWDALVVREPISSAGLAGVLLAGSGALLLQLPSLRRHGWLATLSSPVTRYALLTACFVALFTVIDKQGVRALHPIVFLYFLGLGEACVIAVLLRRSAFARLRAEWTANSARMVLTGALGGFSYLLILWALASAPASYVLGLRQSSIVFGVLLARLVLHEGESRYRIAGAAVIATGSGLIAYLG